MNLGLEGDHPAIPRPLTFPLLAFISLAAFPPTESVWTSLGQDQQSGAANFPLSPQERAVQPLLRPQAPAWLSRAMPQPKESVARGAGPTVTAQVHRDSCDIPRQKRETGERQQELEA